MAAHPQSTTPNSSNQHECNRLAFKLAAAADLSDEDRKIVHNLCRQFREVEANSDIISEGDRPDHVHLMLDGWAARYKVVADGSRQITAFLIPGDFCDLHVTILGEMDHGIVALTPARVAYISPGEIEELPRDSPELLRALWWATLVDEAVLRSWIVNIGRRDAAERIAHLFCELHARLKLVGLVEDGQFDLPMTQEILADALGLTAVHVNRMLKRLRSAGLIALRRGDLRILDFHGLGEFAGFDPSYLHRGKLARVR